MTQESMDRALQYMEVVDPQHEMESRQADETIWHYRAGYDAAQTDVYEMTRVLKMTLSCIDRLKYSNVCADIEEVLQGPHSVPVPGNP